MSIKSVNTQLGLVQDCYHKVASAQNLWNEYRRAATESGTATAEHPEFVSLMTKLSHTAEELNQRREAVTNALCGVGVLQVEICSSDGKSRRKVVVERPTAKISEPHISWAAYHALTLMLGQLIFTTAPYDIAVIDDFGRVSEHTIKSKIAVAQ